MAAATAGTAILRSVPWWATKSAARASEPPMAANQTRNADFAGVSTDLGRIERSIPFVANPTIVLMPVASRRHPSETLRVRGWQGQGLPVFRALQPRILR